MFGTFTYFRFVHLENVFEASCMAFSNDADRRQLQFSKTLPALIEAPINPDIYGRLTDDRL